MSSTRPIVFDSHAILKWTQKEPGYEKVRSAMEDCRGSALIGYMNHINLGEVYYKAIRAVGLQRAGEFLQNFRRLPIRLILPDEELIWSAAEIKAKYAVSYADCFVAATALRFQAAILTGDPEFKKLGSLVPILWL